MFGIIPGRAGSGSDRKGSNERDNSSFLVYGKPCAIMPVDGDRVDNGASFYCSVNYCVANAYGCGVNAMIIIACEQIVNILIPNPNSPPPKVSP